MNCLASTRNGSLESSGSFWTVPIRRRRRRSRTIDHPGIPGAGNRWYPSRGQAYAAANRIAAQESIRRGVRCRVTEDLAHAPGQLRHLHIECRAANGRWQRSVAGRPIAGHFFYGRRPPRKAPPGVRLRRRRGRPIFETELEDYFLGDIWTSFMSGMAGWRESAMVSRAIAGGERDENKLTNLVFHTRHPELGGRAIRRGERNLANEWLSIRNNIVRPALSRGVAPLPPSGRHPSLVPATSGSVLRNNIVRIAEEEWRRWGRGRRDECDPAMRSILEDYWRTGVGWVPRKDNWCSAAAWSAAFISWVMRQAGAGDAFRYSGAHTTYVGAAKRNRMANNSNPFKAYRTSEVAPRVGDLVCNARSNSGVTYDNVDRGSYKSHCDIVVEVLPGRVKAIGGNVQNSVSKKQHIATDPRGRVTGSQYYAIVRVGS